MDTRETPERARLSPRPLGVLSRSDNAAPVRLRQWLSPLSSTVARLLRMLVLPGFRRSLPVRWVPEGSFRTPSRLATVRCGSPESGRPRRPLASCSEERSADRGFRPKSFFPATRSIRRPGGLPPLRREARRPLVRVTLRAEALRVDGNLRPPGVVRQLIPVVRFRVLLQVFPLFDLRRVTHLCFVSHRSRIVLLMTSNMQRAEVTL